METLYFTTKHMVKWQLRDYPHILISEDRKLFNFKTQRVLNQHLKGSTIGYKIENKFFSLKQINEQAVKVNLKPIFNERFI